MLELLKHTTKGSGGVLNGKWEGPDSLENYLTNKKIYGKSWSWRDYPLTYTYNSQGYRCPEFDSIDWSNQVIIFGCSHTFGTGVSDEQTISAQLTMLGWPTINLGQPGTGVNYQFINSVILNENKIKPRAVIYNWPSPARTLQWVDNENQYKLWGSWNSEKTDWGWHYISNDFHSITESLWYSRAVKVMWKCPVVEISRYSILCNNQSNIILLEPQMDFGRDYNGKIGHAGPKTNIAIAQLLAKILSDIQSKD